MKDLALWGLLVDNVRRGAVVSVPKLLLALGTSTLSSSHKTRLQFLCGMSPLFKTKGTPCRADCGFSVPLNRTRPLTHLIPLE
jgi:hypothetical protein